MAKKLILGIVFLILKITLFAQKTEFHDIDEALAKPDSVYRLYLTHKKLN